MTGMIMIILGVILILLASAGMGVVFHILNRRKKRIREEIYHIYD